MGNTNAYRDNLQGQFLRIPRAAIWNLIKEIKASRVRSALPVKTYIQSLLDNPHEVVQNYFIMDYLEVKKGLLTLSSYQLLIWLMLALQFSCSQGRNPKTNKAIYRYSLLYANYQIRDLLTNIPEQQLKFKLNQLLTS